MASFFSMLAFAWMSAARTMVMPAPPRLGGCELRDDRVAEGAEHALGVVDHRVDVELPHPERGEELELLRALLGRADHAEPVDHLVGHEGRVVRSRPRMV